MMQRHFSPSIPFPRYFFATATVLAFVLLRSSTSSYNFHCYSNLYTAWSNAYSEISPEVHCDLSRLPCWKITKRIHSSKPASLNLQIGYIYTNTIKSYGHAMELEISTCTLASNLSTLCWPNWGKNHHNLSEEFSTILKSIQSHFNYYYFYIRRLTLQPLWV